jgi:hypothetical protein
MAGKKIVINPDTVLGGKAGLLTAKGGTVKADRATAAKILVKTTAPADKN